MSDLKLNNMVSKGWIKRLFEEIAKWRNEGLIDDTQASRIQAKYAERLEYNRLINTIVTLGSILVGLGILLFVASNWDKISRPFKILIIFSVISGFNISGYYFRCVKDNYPGLGEGFLLIGAFSFGAGVWLIAQIYQIHYNFSAGILFWILGILPLAFVYRSWMILTLSSILSCVWLGSYYTYYSQRAGYGFFILAAVLISLCYLRKQRFSLFVILVGITMWLTRFWVLAYPMDRTFTDKGFIGHVILVTIYGAWGVILYGLGIWHQRSSKLFSFSFLYKFLSIIFIALGTYSLTFTHHYDKGEHLISLPLGINLLILFLSAGGIFIFYRLYRTADNKPEIKEIKLVLWLFVLQVMAMLLSFSSVRTVSLSYNIILLFQALGFIYIGFLKSNEGIFRLGIAIFFLDILSRYFDIFWKMMPRSLLFILGGAILIGGAVFANKKRREFEERMLKGASQ
ncbi:MAG: DUF2157 domain-containing protein [Omnitrophica bacterium]|nr:DUF2157 domain-containing protein [Candidatus Omnitrophota bacterium]